MISVTLTESELRATGACDEGLEHFRQLVRLQWGHDAGALVVPRWTQLHSLWARLSGWGWWLENEGLIPLCDLHGANLRGADLYRASLYGADLRGADLPPNHGAITDG